MSTVSIVTPAEPNDGDLGEQLALILPRLRRFAYVMTRSRADADDLVQSAMEKALTRLHQWERGTRLDSWLYRIAQNLWIDQRRAAKTRGAGGGRDDLARLPGEDGRELTERSLMLRDASRALAELPDDQQIVIVLVSIEGLSYEEAAKVLEIPIGTVMSRLARARKAIAARVLAVPSGAAAKAHDA